MGELNSQTWYSSCPPTDPSTTAWSSNHAPIRTAYVSLAGNLRFPFNNQWPVYDRCIGSHDRVPNLICFLISVIGCSRNLRILLDCAATAAATAAATGIIHCGPRHVGVFFFDRSFGPANFAGRGSISSALPCPSSCWLP